MSNGRWRARAGLAVLAIGAAGLLAATAGNAAEPRKRGGTLKIISSGDVDYIDPAQSYYSVGSTFLIPVNRALYTAPADQLKEVPDVAAAAPAISKDGKTVTIAIRRGIRFGPPVNREVTAADVKYAIERGFSVSVANPYAGAYFADIVGAPTKLPKTPKPISGIQTPSKYTLVFKLKEPSAVFTGALVMPLTAPVPKEYAAPFDAKTTSDYAFHQVATGPYMFAADKTGNNKGIGYSPTKFLKLVRNPNWNPKSDFRPAYLDAIEMQEGFNDSTIAFQKILDGSADTHGDSAGPPPALLQKIATTPDLRDNMYSWPLGTNYIGLNNAKKPFDNLYVRRAVNYVMDRNAMRLVTGGPLTGPIATHILGPDFSGKGFEDAGGTTFDLYPSKNFAGDVDKAKAEMRKAGYASGMYDGPPITAVIGNSPTQLNYGKSIAQSLARIGFRVELKSVTPDAVYTKFCNVPKNQPELCPTVGWLPDFKEPQTMLDPTFDGKNILASGNSNWAQLNDPKINAAMEKAKGILDAKARYAAWGKIDRMISERAAVVPFQWANTLNVISDRVVPAKMLGFQGQLDLAFTSLR